MASPQSLRPPFDPGRTPLVAVAAAAFLVALKAAGAWITGSLALFSAALDSAIDLFVSGANFLVLRRSARPPDEDHAYGHGKFENLAALGQGLFLVGAAASLVVSGVRRLIEGGSPQETGWGLAVLAISMLVSVAVARVLSWAAERSGSPALKADSLHYATDLWVNGAALAALLVVRFTGWSQADPLVALAVAAYVFYTGATLSLEAMGDLSDRGLPEEDLARVRAVVAAFAPEVLGLHDLKTRRSGGQRFIELHLEIPRATSFEDAHAVTVKVLRAIEREMPRSKVFVHSDPV
ncbi:MAG TPA: cation diffusion facilitator family transporter [Thermoanaerobaculia bacterium]|jgi:ferrous-iron efflux pump FieF|nr:cation diffusion facilitator family transporter [Thermoanaerobaculia bacterium]